MIEFFCFRLQCNMYCGAHFSVVLFVVFFCISNDTVWFCLKGSLYSYAFFRLKNSVLDMSRGICVYLFVYVCERVLVVFQFCPSSRCLIVYVYDIVNAVNALEICCKQSAILALNNKETTIPWHQILK